MTFAGNREVEVIHKANSGHGPTILQGYRKASQLADWVFQCDSDDEIRAEHFPVFWRKREHFDGLFGVRVGRRQGLARSVISLGSRTIVRCLFGQAVRDVNTPYRLMRANLLRPIVERIPADTFAPNVLISGVLAKARLRILNLAVPHECRQTGSVSLVKRRLCRAVLKSFRQTLYCRALTGTIVSELGAGAMSKAHDETQ